MPGHIVFRPITDADRDFLYSVYASTRTEELKLTDWDDARKSEFLAMQFSAQHQYYQENYKDTDFLIVLKDNQAAGRLYIARWPEEIRIVDLALLPEFRNSSIGSQILLDVINEAKALNKLVRIHVERFNPAQNLYRRLGFNKSGEHGVYDLMEWSNSRQAC
jgi:GNAT superfamily N-acetyltransferase